MLELIVVEKCCREVLWRSVIESREVLWGSVVEKCCGEVSKRSVVERCCEGVLWTSVVVKC